MQLPPSGDLGGPDKFFRLTLGNETLMNYFKTNFSLMQQHGYSLSDLENMLPWERDIYIIMLLQYLEEKNQRMKDQQAQERRHR